MIKLTRPSNAALLLNGAAILIAGASFAAVIRSVLLADAVPSCKERYETGTRLSLDREGVALTAADIQARVSNSDWGLTAGARVVRLKSGPAKFALEVDLAAAPTAKQGTAQRPAGIGFNWAPQGFGKARAACLTYSVFLPEGFTFGDGGRLPGFTGGHAVGGDIANSQFSTRLTWLPDGRTTVYGDLPDWPEGRSLFQHGRQLSLERGRWIEIEQEIVLNAPGASDGVLRIWQEGKLILQRTDITFRTRPSSHLTGVVAEAVGGEPVAAETRQQQKIWISPFELRW